MSATLTIDRSNLSLAAYVIGVDPAVGPTLDPALSFGSVTWKKETEDAKNVAGRLMTDYARAVSFVVGSLTLHGSDETDLQTKLDEAVQALTQVDASLGFQKFTITYAHGTALYKCTATEPADVTFGDPSSSTLADAEMAVFLQSVNFTIARDPIPLLGPI